MDNAWKWLLGLGAVGVIGYVVLAPSTAKADDNLIGPGGIQKAAYRYFTGSCVTTYDSADAATKIAVDAILANADRAPALEARAIVLDHAADGAKGSPWEACFRAAAAKVRATP